MKHLRYVILIFLINSASVQLIAQVNDHEINYIVEEMPLFDNSDPAVSFSKYIQQQIENSSVIPDSVSGKILIHFWIDSAGNVVDPNIIRSINGTLDSIAYKIVLDSPQWTPGKQLGKKVKVGFTFPVYINFDDRNNIENNANKKRKKNS